MIEAVCRTIVSAESIRVKGQQEGYRNKISYSFPVDGVSPLCTSTLALPRVNEVALAVDCFRRRADLPLTPFLPRTFWNEVCVKQTRRGDLMVKLVFVNGIITRDTAAAALQSDPSILDGVGSTTVFEAWMKSAEPRRLVKVLWEAFGRDAVPCVVAHVVADVPSSSAMQATPDEQEYTVCANQPSCGLSKPGKHDGYIPLTVGDDGVCTLEYVTEYTPNGFPFVLSPDSFCEVNHEMEDAIFRASVEFLGLTEEEESASGDVNRREYRTAFMTGRDINSVYRTFEPYYAQRAITAVSTCPRVLADTVRNNIPCAHSSKEDVWRHLEGSCTRRLAATTGSTPQHHDVLITAGRHGLHPNSVKEMVRIVRELGGIDDVLYVSCNVESMVRDVFLFKEAFYVAHCRTFDFFPQTNYVMSVLHFKAIPRQDVPRGLLVLPIGSPGAGKTTTGIALMDAVACSVETSTRKKAHAHHKDAALRRSKGVMSTARVLDVSLPSCVQGTMVQRDACFAALRNQGVALSKTRTAVHEMILSACKLPVEATVVDAQPVGANENVARASPPSVFHVVYVDSTNASAEARQLYSNTFCAGGRKGRWVLELLFRVSESIDPQELNVTNEDAWTPEERELLRRCIARTGHPAFPMEEASMHEKIATIARCVKDAFGSSAPTESPNGFGYRYVVTTAAQSDASAVTTHLVVSVLCGLFLFCAPEVARLLSDSIPWDMLFRRWGVAVPPEQWSRLAPMERLSVRADTQAMGSGCATLKRCRSDSNDVSM
jgi:hypothetical protein